MTVLSIIWRGSIWAGSKLNKKNCHNLQICRKIETKIWHFTPKVKNAKERYNETKEIIDDKSLNS